GNSGQGTSFHSVNFPANYIRAFQGGVYLASNGGANPWDTSTSWAQDSSWVVASPWAPAP
ncbi:MAG: AbfB domain-containing protein, partial [Acidimicrobiaceae bacterium]|nr:AbfB domain-containing protein [Acidimicrobiaceae bacterium]